MYSRINCRLSCAVIPYVVALISYCHPLLAQVVNPSNLNPCPKPGERVAFHNCWGSEVFNSGDRYLGEWQHNEPNGQGTYTSTSGDKFIGEFSQGKPNGYLTHIYPNGDQYMGYWKHGKWDGTGNFKNAAGGGFSGKFKDGELIEGDVCNADRSCDIGKFKGGKLHGVGTRNFSNGDQYYGEFLEGSIHGQGVLARKSNGKTYVGIWEKNNFVREADINLPGLSSRTESGTSRRGNQSKQNANENRRLEQDRSLTEQDTSLERERQKLAEELRRLDEEKQKYEHAKTRQVINLNLNTTTPSNDGSFTISVQTNADTASLKVNGEEQGGRADGRYTISRVARAGQDTKFEITAKDIYGNTDTKIITVTRPLADSKPLVAALNPAQVKRQPERDAVAVIIGIADYKNLPRADYANDDARVFYDYAIRALGVKPENIKLLVDADADEVGIYRAFNTWLPSRVRSTTDVHVFYSGHGLPTADGQGLYVLPQRADRDFIDKTAITQAEINSAIQAAKPKSVTIFLDACYSGQARTGETLIASARPVALKTEKQLFPDNFTVITASQADQISSSSPDLKHGIFSYYLMRGMEGDADANKDGKITAGEMQAYLAETVSRQAGIMNRKQEPQLIGDANRVLVGK
jgi:uncharacterized caspase-like protein